MIYIKSILAGLAACLLALLAIIGATVVALFAAQPLFETRHGAVSIGVVLPLMRQLSGTRKQNHVWSTERIVGLLD
jgi:hypothetical protein